MTLDARMLVQTGAPEQQLDHPALCVFDCTVVLEVGPGGPSIRSGREGWASATGPPPA